MHIAKSDPKPTRAFSNYQEIKSRTRFMAASIIDLGRLFYDNWTNEYYKTLGYSTKKEFLGDPDIGYAESTVRSFVHMYKLYVLKLAVAPQLLTDIGHGKLQIISPVVESDPDEWLERAKTLSKSDLIYEVRGGTLREGGRPEGIPASKNQVGSPPPLTPDEYEALVRKSPCCVCGRQGNTIPHHHPQTSAMTDAWWKFFPLCGECHALYHTQESVYRHDWSRFFYGWLFSLVVKEE